MEWYRVLRINAGRNGRTIGAEAPIFEQQHLVAIDRDRLAFPNDQRPNPGGARRGVAESR
jgi:hypothetical protein